MRTTLTNHNSVHEEIKSRLKLGTACYHSVQNVLSSSMLSKNLKMNTYRTIILPLVLYQCNVLVSRRSPSGGFIQLNGRNCACVNILINYISKNT